jgi:hypothetical protein
MAVTALVLAIVSFVTCPVVLAVVALAFGYTARTRIEASGGTLTGAGMARAGRIVAWTHLVLATVVVWFVAIVLLTR